MKKSITKILTLAAMAAGVILTGTRAEAASLPGLNGLRPAVDALAMIDTVQFVYGGRRYCWYDIGWNGPGWYWCGYSGRRGYGFGGRRGFRDWHWSGWGPRGGSRGGRGGRGGSTTIIIGGGMRGGGGGGGSMMGGGGGGGGGSMMGGGGGGGGGSMMGGKK